MKPRAVALAPAAREDLRRIHDFISEAGSPVNALRYVERLWRFCMSLELASERDELRDDIRPGLRVVGFEKRVTITFLVDEDAVRIQRIFYGGVDWERPSDLSVIKPGSRTSRPTLDAQRFSPAGSP